MDSMTSQQHMNSKPNTESLFELLVEMIGDVDELIAPCNSIEVKNTQSVGTEASSKKVDLQFPSAIYYMNHNQALKLEVIQIAQRIISQPQVRHLVWSQGMQAWGSWTKLPEVVEAVKMLISQNIGQQTLSPDPQASQVETTAEFNLKRKQHVKKNEKSVQAKQNLPKCLPTQVRSEPSSQPPQAISANRVSLSMELNPSYGTQFYTGFHGELSDGGLFVETDLKLEVGQPVEVTIHYRAGHTPLVAQGLVSWCRYKTDHIDLLEGGVGVYLTNPPQAMDILKAAFNPQSAIFYVA